MIERSEQRDRAIRAILPFAARSGWTGLTLRQGIAAAGEDPILADSLFPTGPTDAIAGWIDLVDREMEVAAIDAGIAELRTPQRIRAVVLLRLRQATGDKVALRRALSMLALPWNLGIAATTAARTVDAMWHAAGDRSADFSWYTRRATLGVVYGATLAAWLNDDDLAMARTEAVLDRQLALLGRMNRRRAPASPAVA